MVVAHLSVSGLPADGTSVGKYVRTAVEVLKESGLKFEVHAMGTEIECERLSELFRVVEEIDEALVAVGAQRVTLQLKIDDRRDEHVGFEEKVRSALGQAASRSPRRPR